VPLAGVAPETLAAVHVCGEPHTVPFVPMPHPICTLSADVGPGCRFADFDGDTDADLLDFAEFQNTFGPVHP